MTTKLKALLLGIAVTLPLFAISSGQTAAQGYRYQRWYRNDQPYYREYYRPRYSERYYAPRYYNDYYYPRYRDQGTQRYGYGYRDYDRGGAVDVGPLRFRWR